MWDYTFLSKLQVIFDVILELYVLDKLRNYKLLVVL